MQVSALQSLALSVAQAKSLDLVLAEVVRGLAMTNGVALARVWTIENVDEVRMLRLRASIGLSLANPDLRWTRTDGAHAQLPLSYGKVGRIAASGQPLLLQRGASDWLLQADWAERERIESFAGQPLIYCGQVMGVVALFSRERLGRGDLEWLRVFADQAAVAIASAQAQQEIVDLRNRVEREQGRFPVAPNLTRLPFIAVGDAMRGVQDAMKAVARTNSTVLITGESGVGKELIANAIHDLGSRAGQPLVKVNCASVPRDLFESEFFGHVRGGFSGAARDRQGRFQNADGGTIFLDEISEIPLELQGKLLRVLQEHAFESVGDDRTRQVDVRVVAATNRDLQRDVREGRFRSDLFYRLNVVPIFVPPLRDRREDIVPLAKQFLSSIANQLSHEVPDFSADDIGALVAYDYPGNIRELRNIIERAVVLHEPGRQRLILNLAPFVDNWHEAIAQPERVAPDHPAAQTVISARRWRELERENILNALRQSEWKVSGTDGAASLLGLRPSTLAYRMKALGIARLDATRSGPHQEPSHKACCGR